MSEFMQGAMIGGVVGAFLMLSAWVVMMVCAMSAEIGEDADAMGESYNEVCAVPLPMVSFEDTVEAYEAGWRDGHSVAMRNGGLSS